jgi:hypothetical protein
MRATIVCVSVIVALTRPARADDVDLNLRISSRSTLKTEGGSELSLPARVRIMSEEKFEALDKEVRRLQEVETRLSAENASLRATPSGSSTWIAVTIVAAGSLIAGAYLGWRVSR